MSAQNKAIDWSRWQGVRGHFTYWKGWIAWHIYRPLPIGVLPYWTFSWLLPSVGDYCYWDDAIAAMNAPSAGVTAPTTNAGDGAQDAPSDATQKRREHSAMPPSSGSNPGACSSSTSGVAAPEVPDA